MQVKPLYFYSLSESERVIVNKREGRIGTCLNGKTRCEVPGDIWDRVPTDVKRRLLATAVASKGSCTLIVS